MPLKQEFHRFVFQLVSWSLDRQVYEVAKLQTKIKVFQLLYTHYLMACPFVTHLDACLSLDIEKLPLPLQQSSTKSLSHTARSVTQSSFQLHVCPDFS